MPDQILMRTRVKMIAVWFGIFQTLGFFYLSLFFSAVFVSLLSNSSTFSPPESGGIFAIAIVVASFVGFIYSRLAKFENWARIGVLVINVVVVPLLYLILFIANLVKGNLLSIPQLTFAFILFQLPAWILIGYVIYFLGFNKKVRKIFT